MNENAKAITDIDRTIHEPGRLMTLALLATVKQCDFRFLLIESGMNKGTLSSHLARLEQSGYIKIDKTYRGKVPRTFVQLTAEGRAAFAGYRRSLVTALQSLPGMADTRT